MERPGSWLREPGVEGDSEVAALASERADLDTNHQLLRGLAASGMLGDTAKSQIDASHIARCSRRPRPRRPMRPLLEQAVLARHGFDSYLEYTIATSTRSVGQAVEAKLADPRSTSRASIATWPRHGPGSPGESSSSPAREPAQQKVSALLGFRPEGHRSMC